jgi:hypothetical protein
MPIDQSLHVRWVPRSFRLRPFGVLCDLAGNMFENLISTYKTLQLLRVMICFGEGCKVVGFEAVLGWTKLRFVLHCLVHVGGISSVKILCLVTVMQNYHVGQGRK